MESKKVQFQNKSANEINLDIEEKRDDIDLKDMQKSRTEQAISSEV